MFKWYKTITQVLDVEPEVWLSYLKGQQFDNIPILINTKPKYSGFSFQLMKLAYIMASSWDPFNKSSQNNKNTFFVLAGTRNQMNSLEPLIKSLMSKQKNVVAVSPKGFLKNQEEKFNYKNIRLSTRDILKSLSLLAIRGPSLYRQMSRLHPKAVDYWFAEFASAYLYLVYFHRKLLELDPEFVIVSNDHNVAYRSLLAISNKLNIRTAYLQHASVSNLFPALNMDYAFLDGQNALDIYRQCKNNRFMASSNPIETKVILSGQKKKISRYPKDDIRAIGVAVNMLDRIDDVITVVSELLKAGYEVALRWHPGQSKSQVKYLKEKYENNVLVTLSDPNLQPVSMFLSGIRFLVAGNSSIHLEAALAGVTPIYYEFSNTESPDYYGFVEKGLVIQATSIDEIITTINSNKLPYNFDASVQYYSSTYKTEWEAREGDLVSECLASIVSGKPLPVDIHYI